jgi:hypothetical protein
MRSSQGFQSTSASHSCLRPTIDRRAARRRSTWGNLLSPGVDACRSSSPGRSSMTSSDHHWGRRQRGARTTPPCARSTPPPTGRSGARGGGAPTRRIAVFLAASPGQLNVAQSAVGVLERRLAQRAAIDVRVPRCTIGLKPAGGAYEQGHLGPLFRQSTSRHKEPSFGPLVRVASVPASGSPRLPSHTGRLGP